MFINYKKLTPLIIIVFCSYSIQAQSLRNNKEEPLNVDRTIRYGKLDNGLTYYIKPMDKPEEKVFLKFHIKAGTNQQKANQDIAHAIEHIAFQPTKNFTNSIYSERLLDSLGLQLYDIYAYSGRTTVYNFNALKKNRKTLNTALTWFKDIATGLKLSNSNIEKVRGELRQEYLTRGGSNRAKISAKSQLRSKMFPSYLDNSNYLRNNKSFKPKVLRQFYRKWYHPHLMAISIVGNIDDVDEIENKLKTTFSEIKNQEDKPEYNDDALEYLSLPNQFEIVERVPESIKGFEDDLVESWLIYRYKSATINTWEDLQNEKLKKMFNSILIERLRRKGEDYNSFFSVFSHLPYKTSQNPNIPALVINIKSEDNSEANAIKETIRTIKQLKQFGITDREWKKLHNTGEPNLNSSSYWIEQIDKNFLYNEALPSKKNFQLNNWLKNLSMENFNQKIKSLFSDMPEDIGIIAPTGHPALNFKEVQVRQWIISANNKSYLPYTPPEVPDNLNSIGNFKGLKKNKIISENKGVSGAKEIILENGLRVILKPKKNKSGNGEVLIKGISPKGASCFHEDDYYSAINSPRIVDHSGVGSMNKFEVERFLKSKSIKGPVTYTDYRETVIQGSVESMAKLETMLQLIHLYFTNPRKDKIAFKDWEKETLNRYKNPKGADVMSTDLYNYIRDITEDSTVAGDGVFGLKLLSGTESYQGMQQTDWNKAYKIYHKLFGNAQAFTFIINGDFDPDVILPLLQKYLGNLPNSENLFCNSKPKKQTGFKGPLFKEITTRGRYKVEGVQFYRGFIYPANNPNDWKEHIKVRALGWFIYQKMLQLRFRKGYSLYSVSSGGRFNKDLSRYEIGIRLLAKSDDLEALREEYKKIISNIKSGNIEESTFSTSTQRLYSLFGVERASENKEIQNKLYAHYHYEQPWIEPSEIENYVKSLTSKDITETAKKYLQEDHLIEVVMKDK